LFHDIPDLVMGLHVYKVKSENLFFWDADQAKPGLKVFFCRGYNLIKSDEVKSHKP